MNDKPKESTDSDKADAELDAILKDAAIKPKYHDLTSEAFADLAAGFGEATNPTPAPLMGFPHGFGVVRRVEDGLYALEDLPRRVNEITEELCGIPESIKEQWRDDPLLNGPKGDRVQYTTPVPPGTKVDESYVADAFGYAMEMDRQSREVKPETPYVDLQIGFNRALLNIAHFARRYDPNTQRRKGFDSASLLEEVSKGPGFGSPDPTLHAAAHAWYWLAKLEVLLRLQGTD